MSDPLLPCPFCGSPAEIQTGQRRYEFVPAVECTGCGARVLPPIQDLALTLEIGPEDAILAWNRRTPI